MKRFFVRFTAVLAFVLFFNVLSGVSYAASAAELKLMSTFLSNFTELGFMNFEAKELTNEDDPADMIRFGIWHNYINLLSGLT